MAEICSEALSCPISAVSAEPARPAYSSAATTGPSSLMMASATRVPSDPVAMKSLRILNPCSPSTMPMNSPETMMMITDCTPMK